jgi:hypothetical protein
MKIPPSISIGGQEVEIVIEKDLAEYGLFCLDDMRITLRSADADIMESTLRHEMMHAAFAIGGIAHCKPFEDMEEGAVRCLENIFFPAWERVVAKPKRKTKCTKSSSSLPIITGA